MAKERFKTFLLLSLVCISIVLTRRLWMIMPYEILPFFQTEEVVSANYLFTDMIKPDKYLLNFDEKSHTIFHNDDNNNLWTSTSSSLRDILSTGNIKTDILSDEEFSTYNDKRSIVFYFPEKFNTYILARSLDVIKPNNITEKISEVNNIYVYLGREEPYFVFSNGVEHLKVYGRNVDVEKIKKKLKQIEEDRNYTFYYPMKETLGIDNNIYIPYNMTKTMAKVFVENEIDIKDIENIRNIAEIFFDKDIDYIREIIENNGSILYVHNQKVLKINNNGLLEFFNPLESKVGERNLYASLNAASEFLSNYMGVPKGMYLSKIENIDVEQNVGYRLTFRYRIKGIPILLSNDKVKDFIQLDVFNNHVRNYKRFIRKDMNIKVSSMIENRPMLSAHDIINMNYDLLERDYLEDNKTSHVDIDEYLLTEEILSSIDNISLAYLDPCLKEKEEELIGVWMLMIKNRTYAFDVYNGNLVLKRN